MNKDFEKFFRSLNPSKSSLVLEQFAKALVSPTDNFMTPNIVEEREMRAVTMTVFDRLMMDRQIFFNHQVDSDTCGIVTAQLLYLNAQGDGEITMYINSPGGGISDGLGLIDTVGTMASPLRTINVGMAASMGSILLAAGNKGKRQSLITSRVLLHEPRTSGGGGTNTEWHVNSRELDICEEVLFHFLSIRTGQTYEKIKADAGMNRDFWLSSKEALEYGIIDEIIGAADPKKSVTENMTELWSKR